LTELLIEIALLARLLRKASCVESKRTESLIVRYQTAGWILKGPRRHQWILQESSRQRVQNRLTFLVPTWEADFKLLEKDGKDPLSPVDLEILPALRRATPHRKILNRRNWKAITGAGPKHRQRRAFSGTLTSDWVLRLRPNQGLKAIMEGKEVDLQEMVSQWTECIFPERAWMKLEGFQGSLPKTVITCENLGAYIDFPDIPDAIIVFSPGKNIVATTRLLNKLPAEVRWIHFGDLDPEGYKIAITMSKETGRPLSFYIPSFINEYLDMGYPVGNKWKALPDIPELKELQSRGLGIYQERFMLDERLQAELALDVNQSGICGDSSRQRLKAMPPVATVHGKGTVADLLIEDRK